MSKIISICKSFLFVSLVIGIGTVTNSLAQDNNGKDDWLRGPKVGCPGGYYLDYIPHFEQIVADQGGIINADGWVCIKEYKVKGQLAGYYLTDNEFVWPPQ
jgi:hypothetical protein